MILVRQLSEVAIIVQHVVAGIDETLPYRPQAVGAGLVNKETVDHVVGDGVGTAGNEPVLRVPASGIELVDSVGIVLTLVQTIHLDGVGIF